MIGIETYLPIKKKKTPSGWISFNAVCCSDKRSRGGIKITNQGWSYHCFNCGFTTSFILGRVLSFKSRRLLGWLNVPDDEIERTNLESLRHKNIQGVLDDRQRTANTVQGIEFKDRELPEEFALIDKNMPVHWQYLRSRCVPEDYPIGMVHGKADDKFTRRQGVIIPFTYDGRIVGHTCRFLDERNPRYIHDIQPGYVFGTDLQNPAWTQAIVVEGVFDALSINGLAVMHNTVSDQQAKLLRSLGKEITVVPDQDQAGLSLIDKALEFGWAVSLPNWPAEIKDVNDSVVKFGKLITMMLIQQHRETSRVKIELRKKQLAAKLR